MDHQPRTTGSLWLRLWPWLAVLLVVVFVESIRFRLLSMPLERDEGEYAYAGQLILQGIPPYELAYNMKLPGTYYLYALGMGIFGQTISGVHLTLLLANTATIVFVFLLARKLFGPMAGVVAAASYGVMSVSPAVLGMAAHANHFVVLFAVPATLLLWLWEEGRERRVLLFAGLLYGLAFLMKQQGVFFGIFGGLFLCWRALAMRTLFSKGFFQEISIYALGMLAPFGFFCVACLVSGDFHRFWFWTFGYAHWYATTLPVHEGVKSLGEHLRRSRDLSVGLWVIAVAAFPLGWLKCRKQTVFVAMLWLGSFLATATGFYFREHYFILVLPAFAVLAGASVSLMRQFLGFSKFPDVLRSLPVVLFALVLSWMIFYQAPFFFQLSPVQVARSLYRMNPFEESIAAGAYLRDRTAPAAQIAVVGSEPEIYFYAQRHSATGYIYTYALMEPQPAARMMQHEMINEIEARRPEYLVYVPSVVSWLQGSYSSPDIFDWFAGYAKAFYEKDAAVGFDAGGNVVVIRADDSGATNRLREESLVIYRRKAADGTP